MKRSFLVSAVILSAFFAMRCGGGGSTGDPVGNGAKAGSGGSAGSAVGGSSGRAGGSQSGTSGSSSSHCTPGETQACVGPGSCEGGQYCLTDGSGWGPCDCGDTTGGTGGGSSGGTGGGDSGGDTSSGGSGGSTGGSGGNGGNTGGNGGSNGGNGGSSGSNGGASGSSGAGAGGIAGAGAVSGAAGAGAGGTAGTAGACSPSDLIKIPIGPGMTANTGWIDRASNCAGIQGNIYAETDGVGSTITVTQMNDDICFAGQTEQVVGGDLETYWGVTITIELNNDGMGGVDPYDATRYGVDGFVWAVTGSLFRESRPTLRVDGRATEYCKQQCGTGLHWILISGAHPICSQGVSTTTPNPARLTLLQIRIPATSQADMPFDFCINELQAITNNMTWSDPIDCSPSPSASHCAGHCGETAPRPSNCYCDVNCTSVGDCCSDYVAECGDTCAGRCNTDAPNGCSCSPICEFDDTGCCSDWAAECGT